jgi:hypothetical protein
VRGDIKSKSFAAAQLTTDLPVNISLEQLLIGAEKLQEADPLRLSGCLRDLDQLLSRDPRETTATMPPELLSEVRALAPRVAKWLYALADDDS